MNLPSKKKNPQYYEKIKNPIDLSTIKANVEKGIYDRPALFDADTNRLFANAIEYYGESAEATITMQLKTVYAHKKSVLYDQLVATCGESGELSALLEPLHGESILIQCSKCKIWQHTECTGAETRNDGYFCVKCAPRNVDNEIKLKTRKRCSPIEISNHSMKKHQSMPILQPMPALQKVC